GKLTPDNVTSVAVDHWTGGGNLYDWNVGFQYVRKINAFIEKMEGDEIEFNEKRQLIAEAKFLRAYVYFSLIERFGVVPIVTETYNLADENAFTRTAFEESLDFIDKNLAEAIPALPASYPATDANFGRATVDACQAFRSRLFLYAASPFSNPSNDLTKWQKAA